MLKFGIYTSFYNAEKFIENIFSNIEKLNYDNFEWHITDDFSTDNTLNVLLSYIAKSPIKNRIIYKEQKCKKEMFWKPLEFFDDTFDWIVEIDQDDFMDTNTLLIYNIILSNPIHSDVVLLSSDFHKIDVGNNSLHSISYVLNDEPMSKKIKRFHPNVDYLNNATYNCFGHLRAYKNIDNVNYIIKNMNASADDSYHIFWHNSYGKYLHIPRPLYTWNLYWDSTSHSNNVPSDYNDNFDIALDKLNSSDFGVDTTYNDLYIETCALGSYEIGKLREKSVTLWTRFLNETQRKKLTNLYSDCKLDFNENSSDIHIVCLNYLNMDFILEILKNNKNSNVLFYYQNTKLHITDDEKDSELSKQVKLYIDMLNTNSFSFSWWSYIRHFYILIRT
jgi:glycosyltransferase involved in cell wall biosynthesis